MGFSPGLKPGHLHGDLRILCRDCRDDFLMSVRDTTDGADRTPTVVNISPVKQVDIKDRRREPGGYSFPVTFPTVSSV